jgi:CRP/FNR family transcriptional regulator, anaerobic regulatory protein
MEGIRNAIFGGLLDGILRMNELLQVRHSEPLEVRLARAILRVTSEKQPLLHITYQELATEIGSVREVVTRALHRYQRKGRVETGRGWVRVAHRSEQEEQLCD